MIASSSKNSKGAISRTKKSSKSVHGLPVGGSKNIKGSFWVNSKFEIICHNASGKNKFPEVHISDYCPNAKEVARRVHKRDINKIIWIQYLCQCSRHKEEAPVSQASVSPVKVEAISDDENMRCEEISDDENARCEEISEEYEYDGFILKWNKITNELLDPDDDEVMGKMIEKNGEWVPEILE